MFAREASEDPKLKAYLESVILLKNDCEKGAGIDLAKSAGLASDALRMLVAKLTSAAANAMKSEEPPTTLEALLRTAYAEVVERTPNRDGALASCHRSQNRPGHPGNSRRRQSRDPRVHR